MPKPNKQIQIDFIVSCLEKGEQRGKILSKAVKKWQSSPRTFDRLLKIANEQHAKRQQLASKAADEAYVAKKAEAAVEDIMSKQERLEYLTKLIKGEVEVPYTEVKWDRVQNKFVTIKFVELANHSARIAAISELNKMEGDYAPIKQANTDASGKDIPPAQTMNDDQFNKLIEAARETKTNSSK